MHPAWPAILPVSLSLKKPLQGSDCTIELELPSRQRSRPSCLFFLFIYLNTTKPSGASRRAQPDKNISLHRVASLPAAKDALAGMKKMARLKKKKKSMEEICKRLASNFVWLPLALSLFFSHPFHTPCPMESLDDLSLSNSSTQ